jgi:nucleotide-binding universal stress UspA family protein
MTGRRIIVGIDGSPGAQTAMLWAANAARLHQCGLLIVHAPDPAEAALIATAGEPALTAFDDGARRMLSAAKHVASRRAPAVAVSGLLSQGGAAETLIDLSQNAVMLVVGSRLQAGITTSILGSVSHRVAAHSHAPVVVVPLQPNLASATPKTHIVVGAAPSSSGRAALAFAFDEAHRRSLRLSVIRAIGRDSARIPESAVEVDEIWTKRALRALEHDLASLRQEFPDVQVELRVERSDPAEALTAAAVDTEMLVIGCHHSDDRWSTRLGPVPTTILMNADCPIVVIGQSASSAQHDREQHSRIGFGAESASFGWNGHQITGM